MMACNLSVHPEERATWSKIYRKLLSFLLHVYRIKQYWNGIDKHRIENEWNKSFFLGTLLLAHM